MRIIRGINNLPSDWSACVATIGNFDGLHLGHQSLIDQTVASAKAKALPSMVITFEPKPHECFNPKESPARLTRFREQWQHMASHGIDTLLVLRFDPAFASQSAEDFVLELLFKTLCIQHLLVGEDFRFGSRRLGDVNLLQQLAKQATVALTVVEDVYHEGQRISSTHVREQIIQSDFKKVERLLGRAYSNVGRIVHGAKLGRTLGYPTANIPMRRLTTPVHGIYAVEMLGIADQPLPGVACVGTRPVVRGKELLLEVFLFNFDEDIYGRFVEVRYLAKIRDEQMFDSLESLCEQMDRDSEMAKNYFEKGEL